MDLPLQQLVVPLFKLHLQLQLLVVSNHFLDVATHHLHFSVFGIELALHLLHSLDYSFKHADLRVFSWHRPLLSNSIRAQLAQLISQVKPQGSVHMVDLSLRWQLLSKLPPTSLSCAQSYLSSIA